MSTGSLRELATVQRHLYRQPCAQPVLGSKQPAQGQVLGKHRRVSQLLAPWWRRRAHSDSAAARLVVGAHDRTTFDNHVIGCSVARVDDKREGGWHEDVDGLDGGANGSEVGVGPL